MGQLFKASLRLILVKIRASVLVLYFYTSVYFKTLKMKTVIDPDKIPEKIFLNLQSIISNITHPSTSYPGFYLHSRCSPAAGSGDRTLGTRLLIPMKF